MRNRSIIAVLLIAAALLAVAIIWIANQPKRRHRIPTRISEEMPVILRTEK
jgi:ABC-type uncharacterized transport system permease subunit